jgi:hypothetical protein
MVRLLLLLVRVTGNVASTDPFINIVKEKL